MDIVSHVLWAGIAAETVRRRRPRPRREVAAAMVLAAAPDIAQLLPVIAWSAWHGDVLATTTAFVLATPGSEPPLPAAIALVNHHLHCIGHSVVVAGLATLAVWWRRKAFWLPLIGWWLHIAIDIPTHSRGYYAVPFLYPFTQWSFDGVAWTDARVLLANYVAIAIAAAALHARAPRRARDEA